MKIKLKPIKCICDDNNLERKEYRSEESIICKMKYDCDCGIKRQHNHCRGCGCVFDNNATRLATMLTTHDEEDLT